MLITRGSRPHHLDTLGRLCIRGGEAATYLFQVPSDEEQAVEIRRILRDIIDQCKKTSHNELPRVAESSLDAVDRLPSIAAADELVSAFDRMVKLWEATRSGLF